MTNSALIRPAWTPATIALMVLGFIFFWPLGLAMLAYIIWGDRLGDFKRQVNEKTDSMFGSFSNFGKSESFGFGGTTGNAAFDDWRREELDRLAEERRKLEEARADFEAYAQELRRARDKEEFERFMNERRANGKRTPAKTDSNDVTDI
jgi:biopolymer transport protein ExbB/TolQ